MNHKQQNLTPFRPLVVILCLLSGCYSVSRQFYSSNGNARLITENGFAVSAPEPWVSYTETKLDNTDKESGIQIAILTYEWSPVIQFNKLSESVRWQDDLARMEAELIRRQQLTNIQTSEELTQYNKLSGHGLRKVGMSRNRRSEWILFYPEGELGGSRLMVLLYGFPNADSLREMDEIIRSTQSVSSMKNK
jgi:hypothetical protein